MMLEMYHIMFEINNGDEPAMIRRHVSRALGIAVCLRGTLLMDWGEPALGENHAGISTVMGIVGIGMIACARHRALEELGG